MIKEVKSNVRVAKKRNAGGCIPEITSNIDNVEDNCIEYAKNFRDVSATYKTTIYKKSKPYVWVIINGLSKMIYSD